MPPVILARRRALLALAALLVLATLYHLTDLTEWDLESQLAGTTLKGKKPIKWKNVKLTNPVTSTIPLPTGTPSAIPRIQHEFSPETATQRRERENRQRAVKEAFEYSWKGYRKYAWLHDEVMPISGGAKDPFGGWGASLVDTLDTLLIMDMKTDFAMAVSALKKIDFTRTDLMQINVFETTIRYLGGFLSAYDLTGGKEAILLRKAIELGDMLYLAFDTPNRMPVSRWYWESSLYGGEQVAPQNCLSAELGSLTLEFTRLSQLTGDSKYFDAVQRITDEFEKHQMNTKLPGLWPIVVNAKDLDFTNDRTFTFGGMADSLYEYFPKEYMMLGGLSQQYRTMFERVLDAAKEHLFYRFLNPSNKPLLVSGTAKVSMTDIIDYDPQGQHLTCFVGGMVGIASKIFSRPDDLEVARQLVDGCIWAYESMPTGIMPELFRVAMCNETVKGDCDWDESKWLDAVNSQTRVDMDGSMKTMEGDERAKYISKTQRIPEGFTQMIDRRYLLRPEAIESVFILYRITGDTSLQDTAWKMFQSIVEHTRTDISHAAISDVTTGAPLKMDTSESFWMAETLKYFYLIFSPPDLVSLDDFVFNTEAHPLKRPTPEEK